MDSSGDYPQIVLLPGLHGSAALYSPLLREIPPAYRPLVIEYAQDRPLGYGPLFDLIQQRTSDIKRMIVIADSFSGPLAVRLADYAPDRVAAMVLSVTFIRCPLPRWFVGLSQFIATFSRPPRFQVRAQLTGLAAPPELVDEMQLAIAGAEKRVLAARIGAVRTLDDSAILRRSTTPLLYLQAQFDRLIPAGNAAMIQQLRPDTTIVRLPTPHILLRVAAKEAWRAIHRFLPSPPPADLRQ